MPDGAKPDIPASGNVAARGLERSKGRRSKRRDHAGSVGNRLEPVLEPKRANKAPAGGSSQLIGPAVVEVAAARNVALMNAAYPDTIRTPRCECVDGLLNVEARRSRMGDAPVYFTPQDLCMVYGLQVRSWEQFSVMSAAREKELFRPFRILIADKPATDKRGRVRRWASSQAALAEARRIERDALGVPRQKRVGTKAKAVTPPGPLLSLMETGKAEQ